ncbi:Clp protease N-terminal domain-containing protein [Chloroflexota bacterium]
MSPSKIYEDIFGLARNESARAGHYYVGVEHLFIALTLLEGGVTSSALEEQDVAPRHARYMIRQEVGQGDNRRFWAGFRETPRLHIVLRLAYRLAEERGREEPIERDLLLAVLREGDSVPYRVLDTMAVDMERLEIRAANWSAQMRSQPVRVPIEVAEGITLTTDEKIVLQQMFRGYEHVVIQRQLSRGYTAAKVLVAAPYRSDGRASASVVVKLDDRQSILYEKMRYDSFVHDTLPPATARVVGNPVVPDESKCGGLKYTYIRDPDAPGPVDLSDFTHTNGPEALSELLWTSLYRVFGEIWWSQNDLYQFGAWQEYEMMLPPALVLEVVDGLAAPRRRLTPMGQWSRRGRFAHREVVALEGFTVEDFYPDRQGIQLVAGSGPESQNRAGKLEVRGLDQALLKTLYRGAVVDHLVGRILYTRDDLLYQQATNLEPDFDLSNDRLPAHPAFPIQLPNPVLRYSNLLQRRIAGSQSPIHGDLHLHNILVGPGGNAWLIDFAQTREGHTLFDWAVLEVNLLTEVVASAIEAEDWRDIWPVIALLANIAQTGEAPAGNTPVERALHPIAAIRGIAHECLADPDDWREYYVALSLCALRGLRWERTLSLKARRLLFLVSALAMSATVAKDGTTMSFERELDTTDVNLEVTDIISPEQLQAEMEQSNRLSQVEIGPAPTEEGSHIPVQFAAYYGRDVNPGAWTALQAYVFTRAALEEVAGDAQRRLAAVLDAPAKDNHSRASAGPLVTAVPYLPGFQFDPFSSQVLFQDAWQRFDFRMRATGVTPYEPQQGFITFYIEGIVVADVPLTVTVDPGGSGQRASSGPVNPYESIYCSYSPDDSGIAVRVENVYKMLGGDFMRAVTGLRDSADRSDDWLALVEAADVFQLFWSEQASTSSLVEQEWRRALQVKRDRFIRPVFWTQPIPNPPPELMRLPFEFVAELDD